MAIFMQKKTEKTKFGGIKPDKTGSDWIKNESIWIKNESNWIK